MVLIFVLGVVAKNPAGHIVRLFFLLVIRIAPLETLPDATFVYFFKISS